MGEATSKLTVAAEAVGFGPAEKAVDALAQAQRELKATQEALANARTSGVVEDVARWTAEEKRLSGVVDELQGKQEALNLRVEQFTALLSRIHPALGGVADAMLKGSKIAGELGGKNLSDLTKGFGSLGDAIKSNSGALLTFAAGGAVLAGITLITKAVERMRLEWQEATKALNEQIDAMTKLRNEERAQAQAIENIAATRREGGFTAEEARAAKDQAGRIQRRFGFIDQGAINQAVAMAPGRSDEETARIARDIQLGRLTIDPNERGATRERGINRQLGRDTAALDREFQTEATQRRELQAEAFRQANSQLGGSLDALIALIQENTRGEGVDAGKIARALQVLGGAESSFNLNPDHDAGVINLLQEALEGAGLASGDAARLSKRDLAIARRERQALDAVGPIVINTTVNQQHGRFIGADEAARKRRERNGQAERERVER